MFIRGLFCVFLLVSFKASGQNIVDVVHYRFEIGLSDKSDVITGRAEVNLKFSKPVNSFYLHLVGFKDGKGMQVYSVTENDVPVKFIHANDKIEIRLDKPALSDSARKFVISYMGEPADGLIISSNKYGERTFFSDNWPDRARNWIPCNDDPSDKSSVEFIVLAPPHYKVVSNGLLVKEEVLSSVMKQTHWKETLPIPTKIMVIGVARFAVTRVDSFYKVPVTAWVYPQDSAKGALDYELADDILRFFETLIGPYPYKKLANVQSKTIFGGMENANTIFYNENSVTGTGSSEALIAHEIAHQWFGNTVTEKNFHHLWLSEGFATYLTNMYIEHKYGRDSFLKRLDDEKQNVIRFANRSNLPVVDSVSAYMDLLNANSYDKGGWILHMLREELGDEGFKKLLKDFYTAYKFSNANSSDFQMLAEEIAGRDLSWFFKQWLYMPGVPELKIEMKIDGNEFRMRITQGEQLYQLPLSFHIIKEDGSLIKEKLWIEGKTTEFKMATNGPVKVAIDPDNNLLFQAKE